MSGQDQQPLNQVYWLRGQKVMIDEDVAALFQINLGVLRRAVSRNKRRFPPDFLFTPTSEEWLQLERQAGSSLRIGGGQIPLVFTEAGLLMASGVIKSDVAVKISIEIINGFFQIAKNINR
ncbi:ORF6N domain-containing protein [Mucilaginibacter aquatilis]|uniref:KilA-N DNA-binding domain-containing protein n=1 Tax=Mucilaginibacter aquatilis TaxID=1517760 RepID=A0A6I4I8S6_9SPHI|nr:ORF6N domain-containing protein [Mucilaginibacter aquatilis]MVN91541.1 hypothetical protein [Mucilaginibacter aquatilis]